VRKKVTKSLRVLKGSSGFNLAEVIVALGVLSGVFIVVATLFAQLLQNSQKDANSAGAALIAQKVMTERLQRIYANLDPALTKDQFFAQDTPDLEGEVVLNKTVFKYRISHRLVLASGGGALGGPPANENRLKKLNVVVWWGNEEDEVRLGAGRQQLEATRLINENSDFDS